MFDYAAKQIFVLQPRNTGGGILSLLLSFDQNIASIDFKKKTLQQKIDEWNKHATNPGWTSHVHGHINFGGDSHDRLIDVADSCSCYIHKLHFFEFLGNRNQRLLELMSGQRQSVGIYLTDQCVDHLTQLRPQTEPIDYYQLWVYSNQRRILDQWFDIESMHVWPFSDMLQVDTFMDHIKYCEECLGLDLPHDLCVDTIKKWLQILQNPKRPVKELK